MNQPQTIKLVYKQDILEGLTKAFADRGIKNGVIVSAIGSTTSAHFHVIKTCNMPPGDIFFKRENEPFDIVSIQGYVMDGRVHAHISFADAVDGSMIGGHLEPGCIVHTFCIVTIIPTEPTGDLDTFDAR